MTITSFDTLCLLVILVSSVIGLTKGFTKIVINLLGFIASIILSFSIFPYLDIFIGNYLSSEIVAKIIAVVSSYLISLIICTFLVTKTTFFIFFLSGGFIDKIMGLIVGFFKGVAISTFIFLIIVCFTTDIFSKEKNLHDLLLNLNQDDYPKWLQKSKVTIYLHFLSKKIPFLVPKHTLEEINFLEYSHKDDDIIDSLKKKKKKTKVESSVYGIFDQEEDGLIEEISF